MVMDKAIQKKMQKTMTMTTIIMIMMITGIIYMFHSKAGLDVL